MRFALIANTSWGHYNSRVRLGRALLERGHSVLFLSPRDEYSERLIERGFEWMHLPFLPRGRSVLREGLAVVLMCRILRSQRPDVVHSFTPKGVIYGSLAAKWADVTQIVNTITGLGHVFSAPSHPSLQTLVALLYRVALRGSTVVFQNRDDEKFFAARRLNTARTTRFIPGSGVDDRLFQPHPEPDGVPVAMLPARFVEEKGIRDFVEAARLLQTNKTAVRLVLVGRPEPDQPTAIPRHEITTWVAQGVVEWWGWHDSMEQIYPKAHIVCLPTYYMEGVPKSLLEAAACARPVVATDVPGCREIVLNEATGLLVPPRNPTALARAIARLAVDRSLRERMGKSGRQLASEKFSLDKVIPAYFDLYGIPF